MAPKSLIRNESGPRTDAELSKSQRAYRFIRERIANREYTPGYRLVLSAIAADLGVSVVPVREAVRQLEAEGLVVFERNVGARVAMVHDDEYRYIMHTLGILEGAATALSAPLLTGDDLRHAHQLNRAMADCFEDFDPRRFTVLNQEFHAVLFGRCTNPHLVDLINTEWARLDNLRHSTFSFAPHRAGESVREHDDIMRLIENGAAPTQIETVVRTHRLATLVAYLDHEHLGLPPELANLKGKETR